MPAAVHGQLKAGFWRRLERELGSPDVVLVVSARRGELADAWEVSIQARRSVADGSNEIVPVDLAEAICDLLRTRPRVDWTRVAEAGMSIAKTIARLRSGSNG